MHVAIGDPDRHPIEGELDGIRTLATFDEGGRLGTHNQSGQPRQWLRRQPLDRTLRRLGNRLAILRRETVLDGELDRLVLKDRTAPCREGSTGGLVEGQGSKLVRTRGVAVRPKVTAGPHLRRVPTSALLAVLLAACEVGELIAPAPIPPNMTPLEIVVTNGMNVGLVLVVAKPGSQTQVVGIVQPRTVPPNATVSVIAYVPRAGDWAFFAGSGEVGSDDVVLGEYMGSIDVGDTRGPVRYKVFVHAAGEGSWTTE